MRFEDQDPFDLPDWLGEGRVTWQPDDGSVVGSLVPGRLLSPSGAELACALLAVDQAYPAAVAPDPIRSAAHQAWRNGQVHVASLDGQAALLLPGSLVSADLALEALGRLAQAVGAARGSFQALLRVPPKG